MLRILHVSDVHFGAIDDNGEQARVADALAETILDGPFEPDLCIFSGDLAHNGKAEQFGAGEAWLARLIRSGSKTQLAVVPGNHDTFREAAKPKIYRHIAASQENFDEWRKHASVSIDSLKPFFDWHAAAKSRLPLLSDWQNQFGFRATLTGSRPTVQIVDLNTAIFCCDDKDSGNLVVDTRTLNEHLGAIKGKGDFIVAVGHHPLRDLARWNRGDIERYLSQERGAHLYLRGHLHEAASVFRADNTGRSLATFATGASYQNTKYPCYFSYYMIDFDKREVDCQVFKFSINAGEWVHDGEKSRKVVLRVPVTARAKTVALKRRKKSPAPTRPGIGDAPRADGDLDTSGSRDNSGEERSRPFDPVRAELEARRYRDAAYEVRSRLLPFFSEAPEIKRNSYAIKSRVKDLKSILRKYEDRFLRNEGIYAIDHMPDICGFRIITLYQQEIPPIIEYILNISKYPTSERPHIFAADRRIEIEINTSRAENDPLSVVMPIKKVISQADMGDRVFLHPVSPRETGYSSVHLVTTVHALAGDHSLSELKVEIQIRSALEDIWGELDHKLRYGSQRGSAGLSWTHHLNVFKGMIDALVQYLDLIKKHSDEDPPKSPGDAENIRTIEQPRFQMERLHKLPDPIKKALGEAYESWKKADLTFDRGGDVGLIRLAAAEFLDLVQRFPKQLLNDADLAEEFRYICQGEAAYLLTHTEDADDLNTAESLYQDIIARRPKDGTGNFRLGNVYRRKADYKSSLKHLRKSIDLIETGSDTRLSIRHWVYDEARLGLALCLWRMSQSQAYDIVQRKIALLEAITLCKAILSSPAEPSEKMRLRAMNDFLYYVWDANVTLSIDEAPSMDDASVCQHRDLLLEQVTNFNPFDYQKRDTLLRYFEDECPKAIPLALGVEESLERIVLFKKSELKLPQKGTINWVVALSKYLDTDQGDALALSQSVLNRCGRERTE